MSIKKIFSSDKVVLCLLSFISAFPPLSTDFYIPALPELVREFHTVPAKINLTLSLFMTFFAIGILFWGPLSDKYGRKPILYCGLVIYVISSLLCATASDYKHLIIFRILQAFGGGSATAVGTAIVKDIYSGEKRTNVLAIIMAMVIVAPVVAPILGAMMLKVASWRFIFLILAGFGALAFLLFIPFEEPLKVKYQGSALHSMGRLFVVMKNPGFTWLLVIFSIVPMPLMAFIAAASYIYIDGFGLSAQTFSLFFSANAICAMIGPILFIRLSRWFSTNTIITACFIGLAASGVMILVTGPSSPFIFAGMMMAATLVMTLIRPPSANLMLDQQENDTGSASSLINFMGMIMGSLGMFLVSMESDHLVTAIGIMEVAVSLTGLIFWLSVKNKAFIVKKY